MKILFLTKYSQLGASSRIRIYQYLPYFKEYGFEYVVSPLFNEKYLLNFYNSGSRNYYSIINSYFKRLKQLLTRKSFDMIYVENELFPWVPFIEDFFIKILKVPYIVDYDDAIFHNYDLAKNKFIQKTFKNKIAKVMKNAKLVIAGNDYLADYATNIGAKNIAIVPSVIDLNHYQQINKNINNHEFTVGWIGTPATQKYLDSLKPVFHELKNRLPLKLILIGANKALDAGLNIEYIPWSEQTENAMIQKFDVGIMPLLDSPWEKGKCGYKLIQYMACGIPVVASPVGVNQKIVRAGINGFCANKTEEWIEILDKLYQAPELRASMGNEGRKIVEREYCIQVTAEKMYSLITKCSA